MRMPTKKHLVGKTITNFHANPFPDGRGGVAHDPTILLDDGSILYFCVEETDVGRYGVFVGRSKRKKKKNTDAL